MRWTSLVLPLRVTVDLGVMAMKGYSTHLKSSELGPPHQILFSVILSIPYFYAEEGWDLYHCSGFSLYVVLSSTYMQNESQRHNDKGRVKTSLKKCTLIYLQGSKRSCGVLLWEGAGDRIETAIFSPHSYGRQRCVFLVLLMLNQRPWGPHCWMVAFFTASYQQLLWTPTHQGPKAPSAWCGFPYHISSITPSPTVTATSVLTELYNSPTATQSPTRSLESHV